MRNPDEKTYGVPRRFDLVSLVAILFLYSICFLLISQLNDRGRGASHFVWQCTFLLIFSTLVGIGQALLFGGARPRAASILGGMILFPAMLMLVVRFGSNQKIVINLESLTFYFILGGILGYIAGGVAAGVFLIIDKVRNRFKRPCISRPELDGDELS